MKLKEFLRDSYRLLESALLIIMSDLNTHHHDNIISK